MSKDEKYCKILLSEKEIPTHWYNIQADMPQLPDPPLNPGTREPITPEDLAPLFPMELIKQEVSTERYVEIPDEVQEMYRLWRPTPLIRAVRLEKYLDTPARIFYKYEGTSPAGSHKANTSIPQAYYNKQAGIKRITTETGAGQWGSALSMSCQFFGMECVVYMVRVSYEQKPYRKSFMQVFGAEVIPSPSNRTEAGKKALVRDPDSPGSLGLAISEAVEDAVSRDDTAYSLGSVLNHVMLHQTVIGQEVKAQMEKVDAYPDIIIGCCGGGSNFSGLSFPFIKDKFSGRDIKVIAVEPASCPTLTEGRYDYDFGDMAQMTPLLKMYTLGYDFVPPGIHAGGLRYHGESPLVSRLYHDGFIEAVSYKQTEVFDAAIVFAQNEGIIPAPESSHAIKAALDQAVECREKGEAKNIVIGLSGHGYFDMSAYDAFLGGELQDPDD